MWKQEQKQKIDNVLLTITETSFGFALGHTIGKGLYFLSQKSTNPIDLGYAVMIGSSMPLIGFICLVTSSNPTNMFIPTSRYFSFGTLAGFLFYFRG
jgi:hypothetical protein